MQRAWLGRGWLATALWPLSLAVAAVVASRHWLQRRCGLRSQALPVPLIVVGNLIVGGAGKTPTVLALAALLRRHGYTPGVVSRGYGRTSSVVREVAPHDDPAQTGDEPLLLRIRGRVPVVVGRRRADAARLLLRRHPEVDVVVSDDGLQHRQLHRDLELIDFDERGAGNGWLLPAGPLREPLSAAATSSGRVRRWVLYNADRETTPLAGSLIARSLGGPVELADWWRGASAPASDWRCLSGKPLIAAAGIARPERFFGMLRALGLRLTPLPLADHDRWRRMPWPATTPDAIVSEKDAVKLRPGATGATRVWVAPLDFRLDAVIERELLAALAEAAARIAARSGPQHLPEDH